MSRPWLSSRPWDVVIVGAGPSGSMTAYWLAKAGLQVCLLDAASFPRWKTCGGGITPRAARWLPKGATDSFETELSGLRFSLCLRNSVTCHADAPLIYGVQRSRFDARLVELAIEADVTFRDGCCVSHVVSDDDGFRVEVTNEVVRAAVLVGADGANSRISRSLNPPGAFSYGAGLACEVPHQQVLSGSLDGRIARLDAGSLSEGYGWAFPKGETLNVGVGGLHASTRHLQAYFGRLLSPAGFLPLRAGASPSPAGFRLPTMTSHTRLTQGRLLLVGDAAGLVEPFTGDGISYALLSARIAANAIEEGLQTGAKEFSGYEQRIRNEIADDFVHARKLASWFHAWPGLLHRMIPRQNRLWLGLCEVIGGTRSYASFRRLLLGRLEFMWPVIDPLAARTVKRRRRQGSNSFLPP